VAVPTLHRPGGQALPSQPTGKEVIGLQAVAFALVFAGFVAVLVIGQHRKRRGGP
jgi:hypothetical protein